MVHIRFKIPNLSNTNTHGMITPRLNLLLFDEPKSVFEKMGDHMVLSFNPFGLVVFTNRHKNKHSLLLVIIYRYNIGIISSQYIVVTYHVSI